MIDADKRKAVFLLHQEGIGRNQIARQLRMSPNTVRVIIEQQGEMPLRSRSDKIEIDVELLKRLYQECDGFAQTETEAEIIFSAQADGGQGNDLEFTGDGFDALCGLPASN